MEESRILFITVVWNSWTWHLNPSTRTKLMQRAWNVRPCVISCAGLNPVTSQVFLWVNWTYICETAGDNVCLEIMAASTLCCLPPDSPPSQDWAGRKHWKYWELFTIQTVVTGLWTRRWLQLSVHSPKTHSGAVNYISEHLILQFEQTPVIYLQTLISRLSLWAQRITSTEHRLSSPTYCTYTHPNEEELEVKDAAELMWKSIQCEWFVQVMSDWCICISSEFWVIILIECGCDCLLSYNDYYSE